MGFASVGEVALTFCFEVRRRSARVHTQSTCTRPEFHLTQVVSDLALVPSLLLLMRNRRHFEMFLGTGCLGSFRMPA